MTGAERASRDVRGDVHHIELAGDTYNAYLVGDVLVDAGQKGKQATRALEGVAGREVRALLVSHAHPDHAGGARQVVDALGVPVWASQRDAPLIEQGEAAVNGRLFKRIGKTPPVPVERRLRDGEEIAAGFTVLETPGHTLGHVSLWREADRTLLAIDAIFNFNPFTRKRGLMLPVGFLSVDKPLMRKTIRKLAELEPAAVYFGHGPPLRDPAALKAFAATL